MRDVKVNILYCN